MKELKGIVDPPSKFKSYVWKHFGFPKYKVDDKVITEEMETICKLCQHVLKYVLRIILLIYLIFKYTFITVPYDRDSKPGQRAYMIYL